ncbi:MAG TPA: hypothetical protein VFV34_01555 [Blastocatellia bacterium]|nr:hypothetical protein [Blastocatellia bacterium]
MAILRSCIGSAIALSILLSGVTAAQQPNQQSAPERQTEPDSQRTNSHNTAKVKETRTSEYPLWIRIIHLLRSTADDSRNWDDKQLAARVQSEVADLTWEADPDTAGVYLQTAWDTARDIRKESRPASAYRTISPKTQALQSVIVVARKRAPELARKWTDQISDADDEGSSSPRGVFDDRTRRSSVLLQMAADVVASDPKAAAELAKESLNDGISFGLQTVLIALQTRDFSLARQVFQAALFRLQTAGMQDPNELLVLASYLYTPGRVMGANSSANHGGFPLSVNRSAAVVTSSAQLDPAMASDFLSLAANLLLTAPLPSTTPDPVVTARAQVTVIDALARIAATFPEQGQALQQRERQIAVDAQFASAPPPRPTGAPPPLAGERPRDYAQRRVDALEEDARKESSPMARELRYAEAALATAPADYQRGWSLAQNVQDEDLRPALKNLISYRAAVSFAAANRLDKLEEVNARSTDHLYRATALVLGAQRMIQAKNTSRAGEWLAEASQSIRRADPEEALVRAAFGVAAAYAGFDGWLALQALAEALKLLDKFPSVALIDERAPMVKRFSGISFADFTYGTKGFGLNSVISAIPSSAFEDVLGQLGGLSKPETRGLSIILLCRRHLASLQPQKPAPGQPDSTPAAAPSAARKSSER